MTESVVKQGHGGSAATLPDTIIVGGHPSTLFDYVTTTLKRVVPGDEGKPLADSTFFSERLLIPGDPSDVFGLKELLEYEDGHALYLFLESPEAVLGRALRDEQNLSETAREWHAVTDRLLHLTEEYPSRVRPFITEEVLASPAAFADAVAATEGVSLVYSGARVAPERDVWEDFYMLAAGQYVAERRDLSGLRQSLFAKAKRLPAGRERVAIDWSRPVAGVRALRKENRILLDRLHWLQMQYETTFLKLQKEEDVLRDLRNRVDDKEAQLVRLNRKIDQMRKSTSWRLTLPIRVLSRLFRKVVRR